uniref:Uncharacterized protein n=1 Tax=Apteryx owenii TaxID=8824 RepID=A0A8B9SBN6_APTOW
LLGAPTASNRSGRTVGGAQLSHPLSRTTGLSYTIPIASFIGNRNTILLSPCQHGGVCGSPGTSVVAEAQLAPAKSLLPAFSFFFLPLCMFGCKFSLLITVLVSSVSGILMAFALIYTWMVISPLVQGLLAFSVGLLVLAAVAYVLPHCRGLQFAVTLPNFFFLLLNPPNLITENSKASLFIIKNREKLRPSFLDLFRTPQIRKHTFILMYTW